jgi:hypothetical protein
MWTPWIDGDTVKVRLRSDRSITNFGFNVDPKETRITLPQLDTILTTASATLESGQNAQVTVHVSSGGTPVSGATVDILASNGSLNPATGITDSNGDFIATYSASEVISQTAVTLSAPASKDVIDNSGSSSITTIVNPLDTNLVESPHPYPNSYDNTWTITEPGADKIRIHFSRL